MQSVIVASSTLPLAPTGIIYYPPKKLMASCRFASIRSNALAVNYSSAVSVFPAEACETVGGEACQADIYPEVKLKAVANTKPNTAVEPFEREYLDYTDPKTVLLDEACDVLGGDFCEGPYQTGICMPQPATA